jgi:serine protease Do
MRIRVPGLIFLLVLPLTACRTGNMLDQTPTSRLFQSTIAKTLPSVAFIEVQGRSATVAGAAAPEHTLPPGRQPPDVQGPPGGGPPGGGPPGGEPPGGGLVFEAGSGVLVTKDGYIITSSHVVQGASQVRVTLYDRRQFDARVVALDPSTDIAVVKIDGNGFPVAEMGRSDAIQPGEWVLALGSPLGLLFTATAGIISGKGRSIGILEQPGSGLQAPPLENFLQTDAAINPGNSGGPLVDLHGRVIGINTAIATESGLFAGVGFAVPIDLARRVAQDLIDYGFVRRPMLGVLARDVTAADVEIFQLPVAQGAKVMQVVEGGPAALAGVELGDVIIAVDGHEIDSASDLQATLAEFEPGSTVQLEVIRNGKETSIPVELGLIKTGGPPPPPAPGEAEAAPRLGFAVREEAGRIQVAAVNPYSAAARAGVRPGQLILSVNRQEVHTVQEFAAALQSLPNGLVLLIVQDPQLGRLLIDYQLEAMPSPSGGGGEG